MSSFKEWLIIESVINDIIRPVQTQMNAEVVLEEFFRQFCEAVGENYYKDHELDCHKCGYHGRFEDKEREGLECPQCQEKVSDADIRECEHCPYVGKFDEKDDQNVCPKCGKAEVVEMPDPFAGGDEDAKPTEIDDEAIQKEKEDAEKARAAAEEEEERKKKGEYRMSDSQREFATRLKNNALWVRWHAMMDRKREIDRLKELLSDYKKISPVSESFLSYDDDEEDDEKKKKILEEAEEILVRLGYLRPENLARIKKDEKRESETIKAINNALKEQDNDIPSDIKSADLIVPVTDKEGNAIVDRWGRTKMRPSEKVDSAKEKLIKDLSGLEESAPDTFRGAFRSVVANNTSSFRGAKKGVQGHMYFSDPEEVANEFTTRMLQMLAGRKVTLEGKAKSWGAIDDDSESMLKSWRQRIFGLARTAAQELRSPTAHRRDEVNRRNEVNSRMNKDINAAKRALYAKSMLERGRPESEVAEMMKVDENELKRMIADPYSSLRFHMKYLDAVRKGTEEGITASGEDKYRLELMKQVVIKAAPQIGITLNPNDIIQTLETYRDHYASKGRAKLLFAGQSGDKESGGDDLSQGLDALAKARSDDDVQERPGIFSGASTSTTPTAIALDKERKRQMMRYIYDAIRALNAKGSQMGMRKKPGPGGRPAPLWQALAVCVKLQLPYDANTGTAIMNSGEISDESLERFFGMSTRNRGDKCFQYLSSISDREVSLKQMHDIIKSITTKMYGPGNPDQGGGEISTSTTWQWLNDGLKFVCDHLKKTPMSL